MPKPPAIPSNSSYYPQFTPTVHFLHHVHADVILDKELNKRPMLKHYMGKSWNTLMDIHGICVQAQNGLQIMAINNEWPEHEKIEKTDLENPRNAPIVSFMNASPELKMSYELVNKTVDVYNKYKELSTSELDTDQLESFKYVSALPYSRTAGFMAILDAEKQLRERGLTTAADYLQNYTDTETGLERNYTYHQAYDRFMNHPNLLKAKP